MRARAAAILLTEKGRKAQQQRGNAADSSHYGRQFCNDLTAVLTAETTVLHEKATFPCYLKIIALLFYQLLTHKKSHGFTPTVRGFFWVE